MSPKRSCLADSSDAVMRRDNPAAAAGRAFRNTGTTGMSGVSGMSTDTSRLQTLTASSSMRNAATTVASCKKRSRAAFSPAQVQRSCLHRIYHKEPLYFVLLYLSYIFN